MKSAIIKDGVVVNVIKGKIAGSVECPDECSVGWLYENEEFIAPDPTPDPQPTLDELREAILTKLAAIDAESVRPLRAINAGTDTAEDRDKLAELDVQAEVLRKELEGLLQ